MHNKTEETDIMRLPVAIHMRRKEATLTLSKEAIPMPSKEQHSHRTEEGSSTAEELPMAHTVS